MVMLLSANRPAESFLQFLREEESTESLGLRKAAAGRKDCLGSYRSQLSPFHQTRETEYRHQVFPASTRETGYAYVKETKFTLQ